MVTSVSHFLFLQEVLKDATIFLYCNHRQLVQLVTFFSLSCLNLSWIAITAFLDFSCVMAFWLVRSYANFPLAGTGHLSASQTSLLRFPGSFFCALVLVCDSSSFSSICISWFLLSDMEACSEGALVHLQEVAFSVQYPLGNDLYRP